MALNTDPIRLGLELMLKHTKSLRRQGILLGSLMGRTEVEVLVELKVLRKLGILPVEEEHVLLK